MAPMLLNAPRRVRFEGVSYTATGSRLTFHLTDHVRSEPQKAIAAAENALRALPHTPIAGLGFNFAFLVQGADAELLALFSESIDVLALLDDGASVVAKQWANVIKAEDCQIKVDCECVDATVTIKINFHYAVDTAIAAAEVLARADAYNSHHARAVEIAKALGRQEVEEPDAYN